MKECIVARFREPYGNMLKRKFDFEVKIQKKDKKLPVVLRKEEVAKILDLVDNIKCKAILMLVYSWIKSWRGGKIEARRY